MRLPPPPELRWSPEGFPEDAHSGDVFYSRAGGLAETEAVFLAGCGLPEGWRNRLRFAIGELGFGSGLNALAVWRRWRETRRPGAILHFTSIEGRPWPREDAARAHAAFPEIAELSAALLERWPVRAAGPQRLWHAEDGFCLTVWHGPVEAALRAMDAKFDAWFLDGFAPAKNPEMWSPAVCAQLARLSAPGARLATYTVAGQVRATLEQAGFAWAKQPGFGAKRERLEARLTRRSDTGEHGVFPMGPAPEGPVLILGGGAAGCSLAQALSRRGRPVRLLESGPALGCGASGNPAALVMPRLDRGDTPAARFFRAAYLAALDAYRLMPSFSACGVRQPCPPETLTDFAADPPLPGDLLAIETDALWHPRAGVLRPAETLQAWAAGADIRLNAEAAELTHDAQGWLARDAQGRELGQGAAVVLAAGPAMTSFPESAWLPLQRSRGQVEFGPAANVPPHATAAGPYLAPLPSAGANQPGVIFGATFDPIAAGLEQAPDDASRLRNLEALAGLAPRLAAEMDPARLASRAAVRAAAADRLPILGLLPDVSAFRARYAGLATGAALDRSAPPPAVPGLYALGALGARGYLTAPLLAEALAAELCGEPSPLERSVREALHPARFLVRALKRGQTLPAPPTPPATPDGAPR